MAKTSAATAATVIRATAARLGVLIDVELSHTYNPRTGNWDKVYDAVVTASKTFPAGNAAAYWSAERDCNEVLGLFRMTRPGSVWGTDSGSVGGHVGLTGGYCTLNKSGVELRLARQLATSAAVA